MAAGFDDDDDDDGCYSLDVDETGLLPLGAYSPYPCKPHTMAGCAVGVGFSLYVSRYLSLSAQLGCAGVVEPWRTSSVYSAAGNA